MECRRKRRRSETRSTVCCLWKCLEEESYPHVLKWSDKENLTFSVFFRRKGSDGWDERDLDFFKELDSLSPSKKVKYFKEPNHDTKCKERGRNNLQKLCKDKILKLEEISGKKRTYIKYFKFLEIPNINEVDDLSPIDSDKSVNESIVRCFPSDCHINQKSSKMDCISQKNCTNSGEINMTSNILPFEKEINPSVVLPANSEIIPQADPSVVDLSDPRVVVLVDIKLMLSVGQEVEVISPEVAPLIDLGVVLPAFPGVAHPVVPGVAHPVVPGVAHPVGPVVAHPVNPGVAPPDCSEAAVVQPRDKIVYSHVAPEKDHLYDYNFFNQMELDKLDPVDICDDQSLISGEDNNFNLIDYICSSPKEKDQSPFSGTDDSFYSELALDGVSNIAKNVEFEKLQPMWTNACASILEKVNDIEEIAKEF